MQSPQCGRRQALLLRLCGQLQSDFRGTRMQPPTLMEFRCAVIAPHCSEMGSI